MNKLFWMGFLALFFSGCPLSKNARHVFEKSENEKTATEKDVFSGLDAEEKDLVTTKSGLQYVDIVVGNGPLPKTNQRVSVHYTGRFKDGTKFDSSRDRGRPFEFVLGAGQVIKGWDEGVKSMRVGGKRKLIIPPELGYGARGAGSVIPPNTELHFDVELLDIK